MTKQRTLPNLIGKCALLLAVLMVASLGAITVEAADLIDYTICDIRVVYFFDDPAHIDWPTIYYLNDSYGCRVDLITLKTRREQLTESLEIADRQLFLHKHYLPDSSEASFETVAERLSSQRRPDILIFGKLKPGGLCEQYLKFVMGRAAAPGRIFDVSKIYRLDSEAGRSETGAQEVVLNSREHLKQYQDRMNAEVPFFFPWFHPSADNFQRLVHYRLLRKTTPETIAEADFLSGLNQSRLVGITEGLPISGPMKATFVRQARKFTSFFGAARIGLGRGKVEMILSGYRELLSLSQHPGFASDSIAASDYLPYVRDLVEKAEKAALAAVGVTWSGKVSLKDSPHGPKLKFTVAAAANGPKEVQLTNVRFHPYWDSSLIILDGEDKLIAPHQSFVREYLIDIDREHLEAPMPESLLFSAEIVYGPIPLRVYSVLPVWEAPDLGIAFDPDFTFVQPVEQIDVDKLVSSMNWKVVITKPYEFSGKVKINLEAPRGLFAGAYRQELILDHGSTRKTVRVPFTVSKLFEQGIHSQKVTLEVEGKPVASSSGRVRIASCHVDDKIRIGFLPDTTGLLEDVLRLTDAAFSPLTGRTLKAADLFPYDVMVVGSGSFRAYPELRQVRDRLHNYLRDGGSIVVMGQPRDWPEGLLPVSLVTTGEEITSDEILVRLDNARILSRPYKIDQAGLRGFFRAGGIVWSADIAPAEKVLTTAGGATLLSVSRIGEGQIIYCGLPLLEMISSLDLEAIHLFGNILNY